MNAGLVASYFSRKWNIPLILSEHWTAYYKEDNNYWKKKSLMFNWVLKKVFEKIKFLIPVTDDLGRLINKKITKVKYRVIPNVVDTGLFFPEFNSRTTPVKFRFIHISTMSYQKNTTSILRVFEKIVLERDDVSLTLIGPMPDVVSELINSSEALSKNIDYPGEISYAEVASYLKQHDSLILFSRFENLPCVILEALCCGIPVISSNVGGIREVVNESNGILVEPGNEQQLSLAILSMIENYNRYDRKKIAEDAISKFSYPVVGKQICDLYNEVLTDK